ncbi:Alpha/beta-Hydrolases superfamily protein isoform 1 [Hibiscus syriacus]|uniref:Alpha/beta-Hydrolases superfamily protein isoform 1 n=1 Tax=Hibiscus syriacus TaxID=106335 RepID=A0A6A2ZVL5_HIBSY|nr:Alpha/beta-Hydrolases superfamily protein isoform 1 [Hibiscus syriacus]
MDNQRIPFIILLITASITPSHSSAAPAAPCFSNCGTSNQVPFRHWLRLWLSTVRTLRNLQLEPAPANNPHWLLPNHRHILQRLNRHDHPVGHVHMQLHATIAQLGARLGQPFPARPINSPPPLMHDAPHLRRRSPSRAPPCVTLPPPTSAPRYTPIASLEDSPTDPSKWLYGVTLKYNDGGFDDYYMNNKCNTCEDSGGICGYSPPGNSFLCICNNGFNTSTDCYNNYNPIQVYEDVLGSSTSLSTYIESKQAPEQVIGKIDRGKGKGI